MWEPHFDALSEGLFDLSLNTESDHPSMRTIAAARGTSTAFGNPLRTLVAGLTFRTQFGLRWRSNRWTSLPLTAVEVTRQNIRRGRLASSQLTIEAVDQFDQNIDALWAEVAPHFELIGIRDSAFLNWRYADPRGDDSLILVASEGDATVGYLVLRWTRRSAVIADILARPNRPDIVSRLVNDASWQAGSHGAAIINCALPERHPYRDAVMDNGFLDIGRQTNIRYQHRNVSAETLTFLEEPDANVHVTLGDFDFI